MLEITKRQEDVLIFVKKYMATHGYPPSIREICKGVGLSSPATAHAHIKNLEKAGYLKNENNKFRTIELFHFLEKLLVVTQLKLLKILMSLLVYLQI